jgi:hypothetical protein
MAKSLPIKTRLDNSQPVLPSATAQRTDRSVLPFPEGTTVKTKPSPAAASVPRQRKTAAAKPRVKARKISVAKTNKRAAPQQSKQDVVLKLLRRQSGVAIDEIVSKMGWQPHTVRGFFSGLVKKKLKLSLVSDVGKDGVRRYHIAPLKPAKS